jgi:hypothetical protein
VPVQAATKISSQRTDARIGQLDVTNTLLCLNYGIIGNCEPNNLVAFIDDVMFGIQLACPQTEDRTAEMPFALSLSHLQQFCFV